MNKFMVSKEEEIEQIKQIISEKDDISDNAEIISIEERILTVVLLKGELYGLQIVQALEDTTPNKRKFSSGSIYPALSRMEGKGYITSRIGTNKFENRGGAKRKYYSITILGARKVGQANEIRQNLINWKPSPS